jgi:hypothetical protein
MPAREALQRLIKSEGSGDRSGWILAISFFENHRYGPKNIQVFWMEVVVGVPGWLRLPSADGAGAELDGVRWLEGLLDSRA